MPSSKPVTRLFWTLEALLLAASVGAAVVFSSVEAWQPLLLAALLLALALVGQRLSASIGSAELSTAHIALVLSMTLLGVTPAVCFGVLSAVLSTVRRRVSSPSRWLNNLATYALYPAVGALLATGLAGDVHSAADRELTRSVTFGLIVFAVFMVTISLNFVTVALDVRVEDGHSMRVQLRDGFIPLIPGHLATGILAALLAVAYTNLGLPVLFGSVLVLLVFHNLTTALLRSEDRAEKLEARSIHLANMQLGVLSMLMDALALRDRTTSEHATSVARLSQALAVELDCDESEREVIHTAALLHDIGKFTWSDRVLHPTSLTDQDWAVIRRHPEDGAALVGKLDGYGPVADAILYHHERVDGGGYPAGLIGKEIPLASRIVAICSTYDTMTARSTQGAPISPADALAELRKLSGGQLDGELVDVFVAMVARMGPALTAPASFDAELEFERRAREMARPRSN
ncbi:MAG: HD-GYP domain-containing protein [Solirubrobacteraceae bacterium]